MASACWKEAAVVLIDGSVLYSAKESQLDYAQACGWGLRAAGSQGPDHCL